MGKVIVDMYSDDESDIARNTRLANLEPTKVTESPAQQREDKKTIEAERAKILGEAFEELPVRVGDYERRDEFGKIKLIKKGESDYDFGRRLRSGDLEDEEGWFIIENVQEKSDDPEFWENQVAKLLRPVLRK